MKRFDNFKDALEYLKKYAKKGEEIEVNECPNEVHPLRHFYFKRGED